MNTAVVILAAGQGTRMKSDVPKVLHPVGGKAMALRTVETAARVSTRPPVLVVGHKADDVKALVGDRAQFVIQEQQLGTGHAVMQAASALRGQADIVTVFYADMPLLRAETLQRLIDAQRQNSGPMTLLTNVAQDPRGFGRIVRGSDGSVAAIVEERDATPEQRQIRELNPGVYAFDAAWLWDCLGDLKPQRNGEYYLTDTVALAVSQNVNVIGLQGNDPDELIGINTRVHLAEAEVALRRRVNTHWMEQGVTLMDPATTYIHEDTIIGQDTVIYPNTHVWGKTTIGPCCTIGPNSVIRDSQIGASCTVESSVVEQSVMEDHVEIGPFSHLRPGAYLAEGVHMGNFGEVKNSRIGRKSHMGHFSYVGDAEIGEGVNISAGVITCNYDGVRKNKTTVGDHAFIGSDTMLIAPVTVEQNARTAAGAVVNRDVPEGYISVGVPGRNRPINYKENEEKPSGQP